LVSPELALQVASRASCAAIGLGFLEQLWIFDRIYGRSGLYASSVTRLIGAPEFTCRVGFISLRSVLILGTLTSLLGVFLDPFLPLGRFALVTTLILVIINRLYRVMGGDGAEQMAILTLFASCLAVLPGVNHSVTTLAVFFIGAQLILSYFTAGFVKAVSPTWRSGSAIGLIMGSEAYGQRWAATLLETLPGLARWLTRAIVLVECFFPLILFAPRGVAITMLAAGFLFHAVCAVTMGLNTFLIAFPATYLCVIFLAQQISPYW
jgi:hypothetical protein